MKKQYKMENLDCANCASKMERMIGKISGVQSATVNFMTQRLSIDVSEDSELEKILSAANEACKKVERNCRIIVD